MHELIDDAMNDRRPVVVVVGGSTESVQALARHRRSATTRSLPGGRRGVAVSG